MPEVRVRQKLCKGCGLCVTFCPRNILSLSDKVDRRGVYLATVNPAIECTACLNCVQMCPDAALEILV